MINGLKKGEVSISVYNSEWSNSFEIEKKRLLKLFNKFKIEIYHIGSTSIPNFKAKPIIDILVIFESEEILHKAKEILERNDYKQSTFKPRNHLLFKKENNEISSHYIHLIKVNDDWQRYLLFRDYLINNESVAIEYQELKLRLSEQYSNDRIRYSAVKSEFIEYVIQKARNINENT